MIKKQIMKKIKIFALLFTVLTYVSCGTVSNVPNNNSSANNNNSAATEAGKGCGTVLANLHSIYKSTGKLDISNSATLLGLVELGTYYSALKSHSSDANYKNAFAAGLVTGSTGLIASSISLATVNSLLNLSGLSNITSSTLSTSAEAINVASQLINILKTFK